MNKHHFRFNLSKAMQYVHLVILVFLIGMPSIFLYAIHEHPKNDVMVSLDVLGYIAAYVLIICYANHVYKRADQHPSQQKGLVKWVIGGYVTILTGNYVFSLLNNLLYHQTNTANNQLITSLLRSNHVIMFVLAIGSFTLVPIAEELIFRGVLMNLFFAKDQFWPKVILSGIVFSSAHMSTNPISFLLYAYMGGVLAYVYRKSGRLRNSMILHGLNNLISMIAIIG